MLGFSAWHLLWGSVEPLLRGTEALTRDMEHEDFTVETPVSLEDAFELKALQFEDATMGVFFPRSSAFGAPATVLTSVQSISDGTLLVGDAFELPSDGNEVDTGTGTERGGVAPSTPLRLCDGSTEYELDELGGDLVAGVCASFRELTEFEETAFGGPLAASRGSNFFCDGGAAGTGGHGTAA